MRAFSSGAVALSGVEAVSNGVPAFKKPEPRNASRTLIWMAIILGSCFFGLSVLASHLKPIPQEDGQTVLSLWAAPSSVASSVMYYVLQFATFAILILAANTAYADFPRLSSIVARDGFLPRQLQNRGDRLVFSNGIIVLAALAGVLIVVFGGDTSALIPLYAVGVFTGFTLSPDRHGRAPLAAPGAPLEGGAGHQRGRRHHQLHRAGGRGGLEVHDRRLDPGRRHPAVRADPRLDRPALPQGARRRARRPTTGSRGATSTPSCSSSATSTAACWRP